MKEYKIVFNNLNERYNVVELNEDCYACPSGQGKTKSEAMRDAYANHRVCQDALRKHFSKKNEEQEDIIILFNYEE